MNEYVRLHEDDLISLANCIVAAQRTPEALLTIEDVSELTKIPVPTLYGYTSRGTIPHIKLPKGVRFQWSKISRWLESKENQ
jgi:excisionase family DNA binding protein